MAITVTIGGTDRTSKTNLLATEIIDELFETPNTAALEVRSFIPTVGQEVAILDAGTKLFDGQVVEAARVSANSAQRATYRVTCTDWTFLLDRRLVNATFIGMAANSIAGSLINSFSTGFTTTNLQTGLASVDFPCKMETLSQAFTRLANLVGGFWYVDYDKDLHFRTAENLTAPTTLASTNSMFRSFTYRSSIQQIRTRVTVEGDGSLLTHDAPLAITILPVDDASVFSAAGGSVITDDAQILTYTGVRASKTSVVSARPSPANTPSLSDITPGGLIGAINYQVKVSFVWADGSESMPSAVSNTLVCAANHTWRLDNLEVGPTGVTGRRIYVAENAGSFAFYNLVSDNTATTFNSTVVNSGGTTGGSPLTTPQHYSVGHDRIYVLDTAQFAAGGTALTAGGAITYTARTTTSGLGALTGIPASGTGALSSATIGDVITNTNADAVPALTGIPASGVGSVQRALGAGSPLQLLVQRDDATAQTALAALEGGDGIHEHYIQDRRLSITGATARGDAELALGKNPDEEATFLSTDSNAVSGRTVGISLVGLSTSLRIQRVRLFWDSAHGQAVQRDVTATNTLKTFYQYVRDLEDQARRPI